MTDQYQYHTQFDHVLNILFLLLACYIVAVVILIGERIHYARNRVEHNKLFNKNVIIYNVNKNNLK